MYHHCPSFFFYLELCRPSVVSPKQSTVS
uniref:Uncharacterized protein n=1 Tax=Anguilla anguilla TaxID=7936 RepID=A0A0E9R6G7_ANGAN